MKTPSGCSTQSSRGNGQTSRAPKGGNGKTPGEIILGNIEGKRDSDNIDGSSDYLHNSATAHVDTVTREKVRNDLYVELYRFLP